MSVALLLATITFSKSSNTDFAIDINHEIFIFFYIEVHGKVLSCLGSQRSLVLVVSLIFHLILVIHN